MNLTRASQLDREAFSPVRPKTTRHGSSPRRSRPSVRNDYSATNTIGWGINIERPVSNAVVGGQGLSQEGVNPLSRFMLSNYLAFDGLESLKISTVSKLFFLEFNVDEGNDILQVCACFVWHRIAILACFFYRSAIYLQGVLEEWLVRFEQTGGSSKDVSSIFGHCESAVLLRRLTSKADLPNALSTAIACQCLYRVRKLSSYLRLV